MPILGPALQNIKTSNFYFTVCNKEDRLTQENFKYLKGLLETKEAEKEDELDCSAPMLNTRLNACDMIALRLYLEYYKPNEGNKQYIEDLKEIFKLAHKKPEMSDKEPEMSDKEIEERLDLSVSKMILRFFSDENKKATLHFEKSSIMLSKIMQEFAKRNFETQKKQDTHGIALPKKQASQSVLDRIINKSFVLFKGDESHVVKVIPAKIIGHYAAFVIDGNSLYFIDYNFPFGGLDENGVGNGVVKFTIKEDVLKSKKTIEFLEEIKTMEEIYPQLIPAGQTSKLSEIVESTENYEPVMRVDFVEGERCLLEGNKILTQFLLQQYGEKTTDITPRAATENFFTDMVSCALSKTEYLARKGEFCQKEAEEILKRSAPFAPVGVDIRILNEKAYDVRHDLTEGSPVKREREDYVYFEPQNLAAEIPSPSVARASAAKATEQAITIKISALASALVSILEEAAATKKSGIFPMNDTYKVDLVTQAIIRALPEDQSTKKGLFGKKKKGGKDSISISDEILTKIKEEIPKDNKNAKFNEELKDKLKGIKISDINKKTTIQAAARRAR